MAGYTSVNETHARAVPQAPAARTGGINPWVLAIAMVLFAAAIILRKPDLLFHAQPFGDEATWFRDAYETGAWRGLIQPQAGYLCLFSKLPMLIAVHLPLSKVPVFFGAFTIFVELLIPLYLLTGRLAEAASLPVRAVFAFLFIAVPNADEIMSLNDTQWMLAVLALLIVVSTAPKTAAWKTFDVVFVALISLTGPFCLLLTPLAALFWYFRRFAWTLLLTGILAACSCVQLATLSHALPPCTPIQLLNTSGLRVLGGQVFLFGLLDGGEIIPGAPLHSPASAAIAALVTVVAVVATAYAMWRGTLELKLLLAFSGLILISTIRRLYCDPGWDWRSMMNPFFANRYWYIERVGLMALLLWLAVQRRISWARLLSATAIWLVITDTVMHWQYPPIYNLNFEQRARAFEQSPPGTKMMIPVQPDGWAITLVKR